MSNERSKQESLSPQSLEAVRGLTLRRVSIICVISFGISLLASFLLLFLGMRFFTAKDADMPWFWPLSELVSGILLVSVLGLVTTGVIALFRRFSRGRGVQ
jgi:hypothetical protein